MSRPSLALALAVPLLLGACSVPDIVAHGIKQYEKRSDQAEPAKAEEPRRQDEAPVVVRRGQAVPQGASAPPAPAAAAVEPVSSGPLLPRPEPVSAEPLR